MLDQIKPGALADSSDYPLGVVERVDYERGNVVVRLARADYLVTIPNDLIAEATPGRIRVKGTLEDIEDMLLAGHPREDGRVTRFPAEPGPANSEVLGMPKEEVPTYPPTG